MNDVAGRVLSQLTSSSRFHGEMNVDLNEICTNLVPFPRMPFLSAALSPNRASSFGERIVEICHAVNEKFRYSTIRAINFVLCICA